LSDGVRYATKDLRCCVSRIEGGSWCGEVEDVQR